MRKIYTFFTDLIKHEEEVRDIEYPQLTVVAHGIDTLLTDMNLSQYVDQYIEQLEYLLDATNDGDKLSDRVKGVAGIIWDNDCESLTDTFVSVSGLTVRLINYYDIMYGKVISSTRVAHALKQINVNDLVKEIESISDTDFKTIQNVLKAYMKSVGKNTFFMSYKPKALMKRVVWFVGRDLTY